MPPRARGRSPAVGRQQDEKVAVREAGADDDAAGPKPGECPVHHNLQDFFLFHVVVVLYVAGYWMHSRVFCFLCLCFLLVDMLGYWVEMGYVYTLFVRKACNFVHRLAVVLYVILQLGVTLILLLIFAFCIFVALDRGLAHGFFCGLQSETYIHKAVCGRQSEEANLKAVLEKQNLGETVSVLIKNKFYDSKSMRTLNDSDIDTLVRSDELPSSTGERLKSKKAQVTTELTNMELFNDISHGRLKVVKDKVKQGADLNSKNEDGWPTWMSACVHGHVEVATHLAYKGADNHSNIHLKLDAWKLWMIVVKVKDWQYLSQSVFGVLYRLFFSDFPSLVYEWLSHFLSGNSSRGNQRSKNAFGFVQECLSELGLESHLKQENWYCKAREHSAPEWKLFESWQVVFDRVVMPFAVLVLPQTSRPRSGFKGFEFECIWKRESESFEDELGVYCNVMGSCQFGRSASSKVSQTEGNGELMITVMKSIDSWLVFLREREWVIVCVCVCVYAGVIAGGLWFCSLWGKLEGLPLIGVIVCGVLFIVLFIPVYLLPVCFVTCVCMFCMCMYLYQFCQKVRALYMANRRVGV
jgi:hypothetical protein